MLVGQQVESALLPKRKSVAIIENCNTYRDALLLAAFPSPCPLAGRQNTGADFGGRVGAIAAGRKDALALRYEKSAKKGGRKGDGSCVSCHCGLTREHLR